MHYNLVLSTDNRYVPYMLVTVQSALDHIDPATAKDDLLIFNVLIDATVDRKRLDDAIEAFSARNSAVPHSFNIVFVDKERLRNFTGWNRPDASDSLSTYYRLFIDSLLGEDVHTALYIDCDVLICADIRDVFKTDLTGKALGAVPDSASLAKDVRLASKTSAPDIVFSNHNYFNAGVLLMNLDVFRREKIGEKCMKIAENHHLPCHDQDLLNYVCRDSLELLDMKWNVQSTDFMLKYSPDTRMYDCALPGSEKRFIGSRVSAEEFEQALQSPCILHFTYDKPWKPSYAFSEYTSSIDMLPIPGDLLYSHYKKWFETAKKVVEFKDFFHLSGLDQFSFVTASILALHRKAVAGQQDMEQRIRRNHKKCKNLKKLLIASFALNLLTLAIVLFD